MVLPILKNICKISNIIKVDINELKNPIKNFNFMPKAKYINSCPANLTYKILVPIIFLNLKNFNF